MNKRHSFHHTSRHAGKGEREGIKQLHEVDNNDKITKTYADREGIENKIIECNEGHFMKAQNTVAHEDETHKKLRDNEVRNRILDRKLNRDECNDEKCTNSYNCFKDQIGVKIGSKHQ